MVRNILGVLKTFNKGENYPSALINYFNRAAILDFDSAIALIERYSEDI